MTKNAVEEMPHITVVAATTDVGRLPATITSRFMIRPEIVYYTNDEGIALTYNLAARMGVDVDNGVVRVIAQASNNNPRDMRMILTAYRDLCATGNCDIETALRWAGVTSDGLPRVCQDVMLVLLQATDYTLSLDTVQAALGEPGPLRYAEQLLIQKGYLTITGRGRKLTPEGADRARGLIGKETR
jgi:Holliday junction resolvasome RuvABC ATP-dependent DNA helicase subunit